MIAVASFIFNNVLSEVVLIVHVVNIQLMITKYWILYTQYSLLPRGPRLFIPRNLANLYDLMSTHFAFIFQIFCKINYILDKKISPKKLFLIIISERSLIISIFNKSIFLLALFFCNYNDWDEVCPFPFCYFSWKDLRYLSSRTYRTSLDAYYVLSFAYIWGHT